MFLLFRFANHWNKRTHCLKNQLHPGWHINVNRWRNAKYCYTHTAFYTQSTVGSLIILTAIHYWCILLGCNHLLRITVITENWPQALTVFRTAERLCQSNKKKNKLHSLKTKWKSWSFTTFSDNRPFHSFVKLLTWTS